MFAQKEDTLSDLESGLKSNLGASANNRSPHSKQTLWLLVVLFHLLLVAIGALMLQFPSGNSLAKMFHGYGKLTGASQGYNYFAPEITSELRARFEIEHANGKVDEGALSPGATREAQLRLNNIIGELGGMVGDEKARQALAARWAARIFQRSPDARTVTVVLESFRLPSLQEFKDRSQTGWELFYRGTFARKTDPPLPRGLNGEVAE